MLHALVPCQLGSIYGRDRNIKPGDNTSANLLFIRELESFPIKELIHTVNESQKQA